MGHDMFVRANNYPPEPDDMKVVSRFPNHQPPQLQYLAFILQNCVVTIYLPSSLVLLNQEDHKLDFLIRFKR
jgi:hypothetical protein